MDHSTTNPIEKANEIGVEALKQIITLASAILALSITFIKDALGDARPNALATFLMPFSWLLLILSIWAAWVALVEVAKTLGSMSGSLSFVFDKEVETKNIDPTLKEKIKRTRRWAVRAQSLFLLGIASLALFAIINLNLFFIPKTSAAVLPGQLTLTPTASPIFAQTPNPEVTASPTEISVTVPIPTLTVTP